MQCSPKHGMDIDQYLEEKYMINIIEHCNKQYDDATDSILPDYKSVFDGVSELTKSIRTVKPISSIDDVDEMLMSCDLSDCYEEQSYIPRYTLPMMYDTKTLQLPVIIDDNCSIDSTADNHSNHDHCIYVSDTSNNNDISSSSSSNTDNCDSSIKHDDSIIFTHDEQSNVEIFILSNPQESIIEQPTEQEQVAQAIDVTPTIETPNETIPDPKYIIPEPAKQQLETLRNCLNREQLIDITITEINQVCMLMQIQSMCKAIETFTTVNITPYRNTFYNRTKIPHINLESTVKQNLTDTIDIAINDVPNIIYPNAALLYEKTSNMLTWDDKIIQAQLELERIPFCLDNTKEILLHRYEDYHLLYLTKDILCIFSGCKNHRTFGSPFYNKAVFCEIHSKFSNKNYYVRSTRAMCMNYLCNRHALYGLKAHNQLYCVTHKRAEHEHKIASKPKCHKENCNNVGYRKILDLYTCKKHVTEEMKQRIKNKICVVKSCDNSATHGCLSDKVRRYCITHCNSAKHINLIFGMCRKCGAPAKYGKFESSPPTMCDEHRESGSYRIEFFKCKNQDCEKMAVFGPPGCRPSACYKHQGDKDKKLMLRKCAVAGCYDRATYGDPKKNYRLKCAIHALDTHRYIDLYSLPTNKV